MRNRPKTAQLITIFAFATVLIFSLMGCSQQQSANEEANENNPTASEDTSTNGIVDDDAIVDQDDEEEDAMNEIIMSVNNSELIIELADNSSAEALVELLEEGDLVVSMHDYAEMEKVGPIGSTLPTNDEDISTEPGDVILYQGDKIVVYYDNNSWDFTRLGKVKNVDAEQLREILGEGNVEATFSLPQ